ncbi:MAG TPA: hypothetical protein VFB82_20795, partial [Blastocatellia bacterium]|nr:hypothetical protein [Blastocatellia bacterium]
MRGIRIPRAAVLAALLFAIGFLGCQAAGTKTKEAAVAEPNIVIRFRGLIVFDKKLQDGEQIVRLQSGVEHHKISIQIKSPQFGRDFVEWADAYGKDEVIKLEVTNPSSPTWGSTARPYNIAKLHPHSGEHGDLVFKPNDTFQPIFTINQGTLDCEDPTTEIEFVNDNKGRDDPGEVHREVVVKIYLAKDQTARLYGKKLGDIDLTGGP